MSTQFNLGDRVVRRDFKDCAVFVVSVAAPGPEYCPRISTEDQSGERFMPVSDAPMWCPDAWELVRD